MFQHTSEQYRALLAALPGRLAEWVQALDAGAVPTETLKTWMGEYAELIHWQLYNDSYSRASSWLLGDYLQISETGARFVRMAYEILPDEVRKSVLGEALEAYLRNVRRGSLSDPAAKAWAEKQWT